MRSIKPLEKHIFEPMAGQKNKDGNLVKEPAVGYGLFPADESEG